jgi:rhomboid protease GluP
VRAGLSGSAGLRDVLFPKRGVSATEILLFLNLAVAAALLARWGGSYMLDLGAWALRSWNAVHDSGAYVWWLPTLFMHAGPEHLARNMIALLAGAGAVEFLMGGTWTIALYLLTGLAGAWASYAWHQHPPLSVGASGAIFGLLGATLTFIIRRRSAFVYAQRWKIWRVYVPLFILLFLPALANADASAHIGGFASGLVLGLWIPPHPRVRILAAVDPLADDDEEMDS